MIFKLLLTAVATVVLLLKLGPISLLAEAASKATFSGSDLLGLRTSLALHAAAGLVVLLAAVVLAIYKPAGLVRREPIDGGVAYGLPLWVKIFAVLIGILILLAGIMMLLGGHGPGSHVSSSARLPPHKVPGSYEVLLPAFNLARIAFICSISLR